MDPSRATLARARLVRFPEIDASAWDGLLAESRDATIFHTRAWLSLVDREIPGGSVHAFVLPREGGTGYDAALPFAHLRKFRFRHTVSLPAGTYGGVLLAGGAGALETATAMLAAFFRHGRAWNAGTVAATFSPGSALARSLVPPSGVLLRASTTMVLDLRAGADAVRAAYTDACRADIRRAEREGVTANGGRSAADLDAFYDLYEEMLAERVPYFGYGRSFLERAAGTLGEDMTVWVARHEGVPVSAKIAYRSGNRIQEHLAVVRRSARDLRPHHLLTDRMFADACARGVSFANLGGSYGNPGIRKFKASFGARPVEVIEWVRETPAFRVAHAVYEAARAARARRSRGEPS